VLIEGIAITGEILKVLPSPAGSGLPVGRAGEERGRGGNVLLTGFCRPFFRGTGSKSAGAAEEGSRLAGPEHKELLHGCFLPVNIL